MQQLALANQLKFKGSRMGLTLMRALTENSHRRNGEQQNKTSRKLQCYVRGRKICKLESERRERHNYLLKA